MRKNNQSIIPKPHLYSMQKTSVKFQNNWWKTVRGVVPTRYPLSIHLPKKVLILDAQGHLTPKGVVRSGRISNSSKILCLSSLPASLTMIGSKLKALAWRDRFPYCKSMGAFCSMATSLMKKKQPFPHPTDDTYERASLETPFSHYKSMGNYLDSQGHRTP